MFSALGLSSMAGLDGATQRNLECRETLQAKEKRVQKAQFSIKYNKIKLYKNLHISRLKKMSFKTRYRILIFFFFLRLVSMGKSTRLMLSRHKNTCCFSQVICNSFFSCYFPLFPIHSGDQHGRFLDTLRFFSVSYKRP